MSDHEDIVFMSTRITKQHQEIKKLKQENKGLQEDNLQKIELINHQSTEINKLGEENERLKENVKELEKLADSWMIDYQILKDKYEPEILVIQSTDSLGKTGGSGE